MPDSHHDVVIVGAGPVGLVLGRMLGLRGHDVLILERWPEPYPLPRAVHFDDEIGRVFQSMGLADEVRAISQAVPDHYEWRNAAGDTLVRIDWSGIGPNGWPVANFFSQPELERVLTDSLEALPGVRLVRGSEVVGVEEQPDQVVVTHTSATCKQRRSLAKYVIGCDGANSFVRERMGAAVRDLGFFFDWLIVDTVPLDRREWSPQNWQLCDPRRPTTVVSGGPGRRRWEFMRLPGESREELNTLEKAWELLAPWGRTPENTTLERHAVYTFAARWADRWQAGRLMIAGDAAHQMPPFAGQGMCSGLRDAANLSWKLDRVLRGESGPALLGTYTSERGVHLQHAISLSVELGKVICVLDEQQAAERDIRMIAAGADPAAVLPVTALPLLGDGVKFPGCPLAGTLAPQFPVLHDGRAVPLDDVTGPGPVLLTLTAADIDPRFKEIGGQARVLDPTGTPDATGAWGAWFDTHGIAAALLRPDRYLYGTVADLTGTTRLTSSFTDHLR